MYTENGVIVDKSTLVEGKKAKLTYTGALYQQGAEEVYVHLGFGLLWDGLTELKMTRNDSSFTAEIPLNSTETLYFCFRDNNNNWDNNSYQNYSYEISKKKIEKSQKQTSARTAVNNSEIDTIDFSEIINTDTNIDKLESSTNQWTITSITTDNNCKVSATQVDTVQSLVTTNDVVYSSFRRLPENYIRNKKMRIMFYKMFAYVPRLFNGYSRKKSNPLTRNNRLFR